MGRVAQSTATPHLKYRCKVNTTAAVAEPGTGFPASKAHKVNQRTEIGRFQGLWHRVTTVLNLGPNTTSIILQKLDRFEPSHAHLAPVIAETTPQTNEVRLKSRNNPGTPYAMKCIVRLGMGMGMSLGFLEVENITSD